MAKALALLKPDGVIEVRSFGRRTLSGYFKDREKLVKAVSLFPNETFYIVMNDINEACYAREQCERLIEMGKQGKTTNDKEITRLRWVLIDVDPNRPSGVSASDEEKAAARDTIRAIYKYLRGQGFSEPICADSGNGYHLLYSIDMPTENSEIVRDFLKVLDMYFSDEKVSVDTSVFNPARITKLYGTTATKGTATDDRPHRESQIVRFETHVKQTSITLFQKIAALLPKPKKQVYGQAPSQTFDARKMLMDAGIEIAREASFKDGTKLILGECPFDPNHKAPDSAVFLFNDGRIGFKCFHNSCSEYRWSDVRKKCDPNYQTYQPRVYTAHEIPPPAPKPKEEPTDKFLRMSDIQPIDRSKVVVVKTRFEGIDKKIGGFNLGEMSVWSGGNGAGKSTFLEQLALEAIQGGFKVALFSGELKKERTKYWLQLQAAGTSGVRPSQDGISYYVPKEIGNAIDGWLNDRLWLYNNDYGNRAKSIIEDFKRHMGKHKTHVVIIDNLMSMDMGGGDKYEGQTKLVLALSQMAKEYDVHIHFVCHPRKPTGFLRKADISGTADITNAADNVLMMHRVNDDFKKGSADFFGAVKAKQYDGFSNVVEIMKNRDLGVEDELVGLYFDPKTKQMQSERNQNRGYGWMDNYSDCPF